MEREAAAALASLPPEVRERIEGMLSEVLAPAGAEPCGLCGATDNAPCEDCGRNAPGAPE